MTCTDTRWILQQAIQDASQSIYIPRGIATPALDRSISWDFEPVNFKVNGLSASHCRYGILNTILSRLVITSPVVISTVKSLKTPSYPTTPSCCHPKPVVLSHTLRPRANILSRQAATALIHQRTFINLWHTGYRTWSWIRRRNDKVYHEATVAGPITSSCSRKVDCQPPSFDRPACSGLSVPVSWFSCFWTSRYVIDTTIKMCPGWYYCYPWCFRMWQDCHFSIAFQVLQLWYHYLRRMRWTW